AGQGLEWRGRRSHCQVVHGAVRENGAVGVRVTVTADGNAADAEVEIGGDRDGLRRAIGGAILERRGGQTAVRSVINHFDVEQVPNGQFQQSIVVVEEACVRRNDHLRDRWQEDVEWREVSKLDQVGRVLAGAAKEVCGRGIDEVEETDAKLE